MGGFTNLIIAIVNAVSAAACHSAHDSSPANVENCARAMTMPRPFTKPIMHGCGTSRMNFPSRNQPQSS